MYTLNITFRVRLKSRLPLEFMAIKQTDLVPVVVFS
jgi:hypothetical protein